MKAAQFFFCHFQTFTVRLLFIVSFILQKTGTLKFVSRIQDLLEHSRHSTLQLALGLIPVITCLILFLSAPGHSMSAAHQFPIYAGYEDESFAVNENKKRRYGAYKNRPAQHQFKGTLFQF